MQRVKISAIKSFGDKAVKSINNQIEESKKNMVKKAIVQKNMKIENTPELK